VPEDASVDGAVGARLSAESAELALERVRQALEGEPFAVEDEAQPEPRYRV